MYSHDTFGLGHLRRCREIAHALVGEIKGLHILIVSGSSIAGAFDFRARVDFVKIPSVIKLYNGDYRSLAEHIDLNDTLEMRRRIIQSTAETFRPDIFIVDKEPLGMRGELEPTLVMLKFMGCRLVLGLREVLDAPEQVEAEWARTGALDTIERLYDAVWIYGCSRFWHPLTGLDLAAPVRERTHFMGYLRRRVPQHQTTRIGHVLPSEFILVTAGGGGDGAPLMRQVLAAAAYAGTRATPLVLVLGPFMVQEDRDEIQKLARPLPYVHIVDFDNQIETSMTRATAIVAMGGYNTFCEILSFDKRALLVPRTHPRREQLVRAKRAAELGLADFVTEPEANDPQFMAGALDALTRRPLPSQSGARTDLSGLDRIAATVQGALNGVAPESLMAVN
ncbi:MAG: glycosyltransferase family protein [Hyphomicrobiaceae bacterium]